MLRRTGYRRLARINLLVAEARQRIAIQKALISTLEREERGIHSALARLRRSEVLLELLEDRREVILENVRMSPLPAELFVKRATISEHRPGACGATRPQRS
jgi:hypothetical protein